MTFTSDRPITVDGVRLDTLAWNVEKVNRETAARRSNDVSLANVDGAVPSLNDTLEPINFGLQMWLRGTDADGGVPAAGSRTVFRQNLDELLHLFGKRHALLDLREVVDGVGTERRALAKVTASIAPDVNSTGSAGTFSVALSIPAGLWEDAATSDWSATGTAITAREVTTLAGGTERINDAVVLVTGPAINPRITDPVTGMWVELGTTLGSTAQAWRFNSATWASRHGTGLGLGSADTTGTDGSAVTTIGGPSRAYMLPLTPARDTGARRVRVTLSGTGLTASTGLSIRARKKFA